MKFFKKKPVDASVINPKVETLIGVKTNIHGNLSFEKAIRIDGNVHGDVAESDANSSDSSVVIGGLGFVAGNLWASLIRVEGNVRGNISGNTVHLANGAVVNGDIDYDVISIAPGAVIKGKLMQRGSGSLDSRGAEDAPVYGNGTGNGSQVSVVVDAEEMGLPQHPNSVYVRTPI